MWSRAMEARIHPAYTSNSFRKGFVSSESWNLVKTLSFLFKSLRTSDAYSVSKLTIIGSENGLSPERRQAIIWTNAGILLTGPLGTNFREILMEIYIFSFKKMHFKISSGKWRPSCLSLNVLSTILFIHPGGRFAHIGQLNIILHVRATKTFATFGIRVYKPLVKWAVQEGVNQAGLRGVIIKSMIYMWVADQSFGATS